MLRLQVALKYRMIIFTASIYWQDGFLVKRLITDVAKAISGQISIIENIRDLVIPYYHSYLA